MILEPNIASSLDFSINNPSDPTTYFIQAVVRAVVANKVIGTYNLSLVTGQYYRAPWTTPVDNSGIGFEIVIIFSVYTDSGYSQLSPAYGATMEKYVVRHLASQNLGGFAGGSRGEGIDYKKLEALIRKIVAELPKPVQAMELDQTPVIRSISELKNFIEGMGQLNDEGLAGLADSLVKRLSEHEAAIKGHVSAEVGSAKEEVRGSVANHEAASNARHVDVLASGEGLANTIGEMKDDDAPDSRHKEVMGRMEDMEDELGKRIDAPLELEINQKKGKKETPKPAEKKVAAEHPTDMTIKKLLSLSKAQE